MRQSATIDKKNQCLHFLGSKSLLRCKCFWPSSLSRWVPTKILPSTSLSNSCESFSVNHLNLSPQEIETKSPTLRNNTVKYGLHKGRNVYRTKAGIKQVCMQHFICQVNNQRRLRVLHWRKSINRGKELLNTYSIKTNGLGPAEVT